MQQTDVEIAHSSVVNYDFYAAYNRPIQSDTQAYLSQFLAPKIWSLD